jgi:hypothetical protein
MSLFLQIFVGFFSYLRFLLARKILYSHNTLYLYQLNPPYDLV